MSFTNQVQSSLKKIKIVNSDFELSLNELKTYSYLLVFYSVSIHANAGSFWTINFIAIINAISFDFSRFNDYY